MPSSWSQNGAESSDKMPPTRYAATITPHHNKAKEENKAEHCFLPPPPAFPSQNSSNSNTTRAGLVAVPCFNATLTCDGVCGIVDPKSRDKQRTPARCCASHHPNRDHHLRVGHASKPAHCNLIIGYVVCCVCALCVCVLCGKGVCVWNGEHHHHHPTAQKQHSEFTFTHSHMCMR